MGDPALDIKNDPLAIEGLEQIFEIEPVTVIQETDAAQVTGATPPVPTSAKGVPVEEAANLFGTSANALKKRLRKGTLKGIKVEAKHGEKWFVDSSELTDYLAPVTEAQATDAAPVTAIEVPVTGATPPVPTSAAGVPSADLVLRIQDLERKLEGATYRNGYLEAENEGLKTLVGAKDSQIKLLTDSQHKRGWWTRFASWFIGAKT